MNSIDNGCVDAVRFGAAEWKRYYGVDVGGEPALPNRFYTWWLSADQAEPEKRNCDTHLPPVLRPRWITETDAVGKKTLACFSHRTLARLVERPQEGLSSRYAFNGDFLHQHAATKGGPSCWLVMRKNGFARDQTYEQQRTCIEKLNTAGADYDAMPSVLDLATVVFMTYVLTGGDRYLGDKTGKEGTRTVSRCEERMRIGKYSYPVFLGGLGPDGLIARESLYAPDSAVVAALRRF